MEGIEFWISNPNSDDIPGTLDAVPSLVTRLLIGHISYLNTSILTQSLVRSYLPTFFLMTCYRPVFHIIFFKKEAWRRVDLHPPAMAPT